MIHHSKRSSRDGETVLDASRVAGETGQGGSAGLSRARGRAAGREMMGCMVSL